LPGARCYAEDYYDPVLENRVLDANSVALRASNRESVTLQPLRLRDHDVQSGGVSLSCHNDNCYFTIKKGALPGTDNIVPLLKVRIQPNKRYMLGFRYSFAGYKGMFQLVGENFLREYRPPDQGVKKIPLWTSDPKGKEVTMRFIGHCSKVDEDCSVELRALSVGTYEHANLPIKISSLIPYSASVEVDGSATLETNRLYLPGYHAMVNGVAVSVARSPDGMTMIPLTSGKNEITLDYTGTPAMRFAFLVSTVSWFALLGVAGMVWVRKQWRRYDGKTKRAFSSESK
jgi:hypothetical protein